MMTKHFFFMALLTLHATDACENSQWLGDGICDDGNNNKECGWDVGDCCGEYVNTDFCSQCECLNPNGGDETTTMTTTTIDYSEILSSENNKNAKLFSFA